MYKAGFEQLNAARMSAAGEGWTEPNLNFHPIKGMKMQTNTACSYKAPDSYLESGASFYSALVKMIQIPFLFDSHLQLCYA